jgi:uncharacterized protein YidB (DUF937 family)
VLDPDQLQDVAATFGVDESQVLRDHLISHLPAAISSPAVSTAQIRSPPGGPPHQ